MEPSTTAPAVTSSCSTQGSGMFAGIGGGGSRLTYLRQRGRHAASVSLLGGGACATAAIGSAQAVDDALKCRDLKDNAGVKSADS